MPTRSQSSLVSLIRMWPLRHHGLPGQICAVILSAAFVAGPTATVRAQSPAETAQERALREFRNRQQQQRRANIEALRLQRELRERQNADRRARERDRMRDLNRSLDAQQRRQLNR